MARKPKAASSNDFAISAEQVLAVLGDAPAPVRRGSKPKAAALPEPLATMDSDDAGETGTAGATPSVATMEDMPVKRRPGRPRKQTAEPSSSPQEDAGDQPESDAGRSDALTTPAPVGDDAMIAEMAYPVRTMARIRAYAELGISTIMPSSGLCRAGGALPWRSTPVVVVCSA